MTGLFRGWRSCTIWCFANNCCTRFDEPVTAWPETRSFPSHCITQSFQNFNVIFFVDRLTSWSKFVLHNTLTIEKNNQHWLPAKKKRVSERFSPGVMHTIRSETLAETLGETFWREKSRQQSRQKSHRESRQDWLYAWLPARLSPRLVFFYTGWHGSDFDVLFSAHFMPIL